MNNLHNDHQSNPDREHFIRQIASLTPAPVPVDPHQMFYQAGYAAATEHHRRKVRRHIRLAAAACLATICLVGAAGYRLGANANTHLANSNQPDPAAPSPVSIEPSRPIDPQPQPVSRDVPIQFAAQQKSVPIGLMTQWLGSRLNTPAERPLSLLGTKDTQDADQSSDALLPTSSAEATTEAILQRRSWQAILPTL